MAQEFVAILSRYRIAIDEHVELVIVMIMDKNVCTVRASSGAVLIFPKARISAGEHRGIK